MHRLALLIVALSLGGCVNLAPPYQRPEPSLPARPIATDATPDRGMSTPDWRALFLDARLRDVVGLALRENRDLRVAALRVEQVRAQFRQTQARNLPEVSVAAGARRSSAAGSAASDEVSLQLAMTSYELDFFGRVRNLNASAEQSLLGAIESRHSAQITLVAETASAWLTWAADLERQRLAEQTLQSLERAFELTRSRYAAGAVSSLMLAQAETAVLNARAELATNAVSIEQDRHALELLLGTALPKELEPQASDTGAAVSLLADVPDGVPSHLLQRRPDVLAAEHALIARHADIGVARAARFPSISLTASAGVASSALSGLFKAGSGSWGFGPTATLPVFDAGARAANVRQAEVGRDIALAAYDKTLQVAFREVADALAVRASLTDRLTLQQNLLAAANRQLRLAEARYRSGSTSQLDLLDAQRTQITAQQALVTLRLAEQLNRIALSKVLGGGWRDVEGTGTEERRG